MNKNYRYLLILGWPLLTVNVLFALLYAVFIARGRSWAFREGVLTYVAGTRKDGATRLWGGPAGQGWSPIVAYASEAQRADADLRVHENVHVWQELMWAHAALALVPVLLALNLPTAALITAFSGGPMFALTYGASFLMQYRRARGWYEAYTQIIYERQAYRLQEQYLDDMSPAQRETIWGHH